MGYVGGWMMNNTKLPVSLEDTTELRKLIIENPDLPLLIFCGPETNSGEYPYESTTDVGCDMQKLTLYKDWWIPKDEYEEQLRDDLSDKAEYKDMTDEEYDAMIDQKVNETEFVKAIVIYVG